MPSSKKTVKGLNQWQPNDYPSFDDHNSDNKAISDEAMWKNDYATNDKPGYVDNAIHADTASEADNALNANHASTADTATTALNAGDMFKSVFDPAEDGQIKGPAENAGGIEQLILKSLASFIPPGTPLPYMGEFLSDEEQKYWLLIKSDADLYGISRTEEARIFERVGIKYGAGDGETTFDLAGIIDRVVVGAGGSRVLGETFGSETHTNVLDENGIAGVQFYGTSPLVGYISRTRIADSETKWRPNLKLSNVGVVTFSGNDTSEGTALAGRTAGGSSIQPSIALNYIIRR